MGNNGRKSGNKVSPPFQGGVAGKPDYLIFTRSIPRPGWLIYLYFTSPYSDRNKLLKVEDKTNYRKALDSGNQPPRPQSIFAMF